MRAHNRVKLLSTVKPIDPTTLGKPEKTHVADTAADADADERAFIKQIVNIRNAPNPEAARQQMGIHDEIEAAQYLSKLRGEPLRALGADEHRNRLKLHQVQAEQAKRAQRLHDASKVIIDPVTGAPKLRESEKAGARPQAMDQPNRVRLEDMTNAQAGYLRSRFNAPALEAEYSGSPEDARFVGFVPPQADKVTVETNPPRLPALTNGPTNSVSSGGGGGGNGKKALLPGSPAANGGASSSVAGTHMTRKTLDNQYLLTDGASTATGATGAGR